MKAISTFESAVKPSTNEVYFEEKFEKPIFIEKFPSEISIFNGEGVKFECIVVGKPTPKVNFIDRF